jgi:hypothetical protein
MSDVMKAAPPRRLRDIMAAGILGEAVAAEFALVADDIAATVRVGEMLEAGPRERVAMYPASMHGLSALVYGLAGLMDARTAPAAIEIVAEMRRLDALRPEPEFRRLPLGELATWGFETLIRRGLELGLAEAFLASPAYAAYAAERRELGLE